MTAHANICVCGFLFTQINFGGKMEANLTNEEFIDQFESGSLPTEYFNHRQHVRAAWIYLQKNETLEALKLFSTSLKNYARTHGAKNLYHETITWAFVFLINERLEHTGREKAWEDFASENEDVLNWQDNVLKKYYRPETLQSDLARRVFVFPDNLIQISK
jgi:hypothetical protein